MAVSFRESAASTLASSGRGSRRCGRLKKMRGDANGLPTTSRRPNNSAPLKIAERITSPSLPSLQADFLVNQLPQPGSASARRMTAISGRRCFEFYRRSNPHGPSLRMFLDLLLSTEGWFSSRCYLTWKVSVTMSRRWRFRLVPSGHRSKDFAFGLWPTLTTGDGQSGRTYQYNRTQRKNPAPTLLGMARLGLLPTLTARDERTVNGCRPRPAPQGGDHLLCTLADRLKRTTGKLNPAWASWYMGFPTGWLVRLKPSGMPSSHKSQRPSDG